MVEYIMKWVWGKVYNDDTEKFSKLYAQVSADIFISSKWSPSISKLVS